MLQDGSLKGRRGEVFLHPYFNFGDAFGPGCAGSNARALKNMTGGFMLCPAARASVMGPLASFFHLGAHCNVSGRKFGDPSLFSVGKGFDGLG